MGSRWKKWEMCSGTPLRCAISIASLKGSKKTVPQPVPHVGDVDASQPVPLFTKPISFSKLATPATGKAVERKTAVPGLNALNHDLPSRAVRPVITGYFAAHPTKKRA